MSDKLPAATITLYDAENTIDIRLDIPDDVDITNSPAAQCAHTLVTYLQKLKDTLAEESLTAGESTPTTTDANSTESVMAEPAEPLQ